MNLSDLELASVLQSRRRVEMDVIFYHFSSLLVTQTRMSASLAQVLISKSQLVWTAGRYPAHAVSLAPRPKTHARLVSLAVSLSSSLALPEESREVSLGITRYIDTLTRYSVIDSSIRNRVRYASLCAPRLW